MSDERNTPEFENDKETTQSLDQSCDPASDVAKTSTKKAKKLRERKARRQASPSVYEPEVFDLESEMAREEAHEQKRGRRQEIVGQAICIVLVLSLLCAMIATELTRLQHSVMRRTVAVASYERGESYTAYVFRDERVVTTMNAGAVAYATSDGAIVSADTLVADVYGNDTGTDERAMAAALWAEIEKREAALETNESKWTVDYVLSYTDLMSSLSGGNFLLAQSQTSSVSNALARRDTLGNEEIATLLREEIDELYAQIEALIRYEDEPEHVTAGMNGIFYRDTDGYESIFDISATDYITPSDLTDLLNAPPSSPLDAVGRVISTNEFRLVLPLARDVANTYTVGNNYVVRFEECGVNATLTLERIATDESGNALLILKGDILPVQLSNTRRQSVVIVRETVTGLRIPLSSLSENGTVFIDDNGKAKEIRITPILREDGCCLVALPTSAQSGLKEGDRILVDARRMYDGKVVN